MKENTKITWKLLFGSLIKNDYAIEGAKTRPWWIALILFILGTFLPIIPIMVNASKTYGSSFMNSTSIYNFDQALIKASLDLKASLNTFEINEGNQLIRKIDGVAQEKTWINEADTTPIYVYHSVNGDADIIDLRVYYTDRPYSGTTYSVKNMISKIEETRYVKNTTSIYRAENFPDLNTKTDLYIPSYLILYKTGSYGKIFKTNTVTAAATMYTGMNWKGITLNNTNDLLTHVLTVDGVEANELDINYVRGVSANYKKVFNQGYITQKWNSFWFTSGLYWGIYIVLIAFLGLLMFLLTRGKNNPNRNLTIWIGMKIGAWIVITPGLLAMILGFVWAQAAGLGFIVLIGLRSMWLSMRQLGPMAETQQ